MKSSGKSASIGSSVEPGLPKIVVIPWARNRSNVASLTVLMAYSPASTSAAARSPERTAPSM